MNTERIEEKKPRLEQMDIFSYLQETELTTETLETEESEDLTVGGFDTELLTVFNYSDYSEKILTDDDLMSIILAKTRTAHELHSIEALDNAYLPSDESMNLYSSDSLYLSVISPKGIEDFFNQDNIVSSRESEVFQRYQIEMRFGKYYKPTYLVEELEAFPVINFHESKKKLVNTVHLLINYLFEDFHTKIEGDTIRIRFDTPLIEKVDRLFKEFPKPRDFFTKIKEEHYPLYFLIRPYMEMTQLPDSFYSPVDSASEWLSRFLGNYDIEVDKVDGFYEMSFRPSDFTYSYRSNRSWRSATLDVSDVYTVLKGIYNVIVPLYMLYDASDTLIQSVKDVRRETLAEAIKEVSAARESFLESLSNRLVPIQELNHKTAVKEAEKLGMTYFFMPFSNKHFTFRKGTPLLVHELGDAFGQWEALPPDPFFIEETNIHYKGISTYESYYEEHPYMATRSAPHLLGNERMNVSIHEEEFTDVFAHLFKDWEHYEVFANTQKIIEKYPLVSKRLADLSPVDVSTLEEKTESEAFDTLFKKDIPYDLSVLGDLEEQLTIEGTDEQLEKGSLVFIDDLIYRLDNISIDAESKALGVFTPMASSDSSNVTGRIEDIDFHLATEEELASKKEAFFENGFLSYARSLNTGVGVNTSVFRDRGTNRLYVFHRGEFVKFVDSDSHLFFDEGVKTIIYNMIHNDELEGLQLPFIIPSGYFSSMGWNLGEDLSNLNVRIRSNSYVYLNPGEMTDYILP